MQPTPTAASAPSMGLTAWVTILAPVVAVLIKSASGGWLMVYLIFWSPLWVAGYVLLVVAVARGCCGGRACFVSVPGAGAGRCGRG